jgi:hypothetical protein
MEPIISVDALLAMANRRDCCCCFVSEESRPGEEEEREEAAEEEAPVVRLCLFFEAGENFLLGLTVIIVFPMVRRCNG